MTSDAKEADFECFKAHGANEVTTADTVEALSPSGLSLLTLSLAPSFSLLISFSIFGSFCEANICRLILDLRLHRDQSTRFLVF